LIAMAQLLHMIQNGRRSGLRIAGCVGRRTAGIVDRCTFEK